MNRHFLCSGLVPAFLFLSLSFILYAQTLFYPFVHDDLFFIVHNPGIKTLDQNWWTIFTQSSWPMAGVGVANTYYRPFLEFFNRLQFAVFGLHPGGYHAVNVFIHGVNAFLIFCLLRALSGRMVLAFMLALVFLCHPLQSEAVASIAGISNVLVLCFGLLSFCCYLRIRESPGVFAGVWMGLTQVFFGAALLVKEQAVVWPLLMLWHDVFFHSSQTRDGGSQDFEEKQTARSFLKNPAKSGSRLSRIRRGLVHAGPFLITFLLYFCLRSYVFSGGGVPSLGMHPEELLRRLAALPEILFTYGGLVLLPVGLHYYRGLHLESISYLSALGLLSLLAFGLYGLMRLKGQARALGLFGMGWFVIAFLPTANIVPLVIEYDFVSVAEHFMYVPFLGILCLGAGLLLNLPLPKKRLWRWIGGGILILLAFLTLRQSRYWQTDIALFERTLAIEKNFGRGHMILAKAYYTRGNYSKAMEHYQQALTVMLDYRDKVKTPQAWPFYEGFIKEIYFDLAHCWWALGKSPEALVSLEQALFWAPSDPAIYNNMGLIYLSQRQWPQATAVFYKAFELNPRDVQILNNLALCYLQQNDRGRAEALLRQAVLLQPDFETAKKNLQSLLDTPAP